MQAMFAALFDTSTALGLSAFGLLFFALATLLVLLIRRAERRFESHLSDTMIEAPASKAIALERDRT